LLEGRVPYEFRTTVVKGFHTREDFDAIGMWLRGAEKYVLQNFEDSGDLIQSGLEGVGKEMLEAFAGVVRAYVLWCR
jgi:pyruvate formate lyase activating enzyme